MGQLSNRCRTLLRVLDRGILPAERAPQAHIKAESGLKSDHRQVLRRLRPVDIDSLIAAYGQGQSVRSLVELFGIHRTTVLARLERHGVSRRRTVCKLTGADVTEAAALYASGLSLAAIGERFKVEGATVGNALRRSGVQLRPRRGWVG